MSRLGGGSLIALAIVLLLLGVIIQSNAVEWLVRLILNVIGILFIVAGIVVAIFGIIKLFSRGSRKSAGY